MAWCSVRGLEMLSDDCVCIDRWLAWQVLTLSLSQFSRF